MSIIVSGSEFRTIDDDIFVNGSKVQRVDVNNSMVYPDTERVPGAYVLKAIGRTSYTAPAVKMSSIEIGYGGTPLVDIYQHEIKCSASFSMAAVVNNVEALSISDGGAVPSVTYDDLSYGPGYRQKAHRLIYSGGWVIPWGGHQTFPRFMIGSKMAPFSKHIRIERKYVLSFEMKIKLSVSFAWPTFSMSRLNHSPIGRLPIHHSIDNRIVTDFTVKPIDVLRPRILTFLNNTHSIRTDTGKLPTTFNAANVIFNTLNYEDILDESEFRYYSFMPHELKLISDFGSYNNNYNRYIFDNNIVDVYMLDSMEYFEQSFIERDSMKRVTEIVPDWMGFALTMIAIPIMNILYVGPSEEAPGWAFKALDTDL